MLHSASEREREVGTHHHEAVSVCPRCLELNFPFDVLPVQGSVRNRRSDEKRSSELDIERRSS